MAASGSAIDLTWVDNSINEDGFRVEQAPDVAGAAGAFAEIATVAANATSYSSTALTDGTRYWYRVVAYNAVGLSGYSNTTSATTPVIPRAPTAPATLTAVASGNSVINLAWADNSANEDGFRVERAPTVGGVAGTFVQIATVASNATSYSNTGLSAGTRYWYRVQAYNAVGGSAYSNVANATTVSGSVPIAPTNLEADVYHTDAIDLNWADDPTNETGYHLERAPDVGGAPGTFTLILTLPANSTWYSDDNNGVGLSAGTYWYRVRAFNAAGPSAYAPMKSATLVGPPVAPTSLQGTAVSSVLADLTWTDNSTDESGFRIQRAPDVGGVPGTFVTLATVGVGVTTYRANSMTASTKYWFRVQSYNAVGNSAYSNNATVTTTAYVAPSALTGTAYVVGSTRNVDLSWTRGSEVTVDIWRGSTRIATARVNDGGVYNNKPSVSLGDTLTYQVCAAGRTGTANCSTAVVNF